MRRHFLRQRRGHVHCDVWGAAYVPKQAFLLTVEDDMPWRPCEAVPPLERLIYRPWGCVEPHGLATETQMIDVWLTFQQVICGVGVGMGHKHRRVAARFKRLEISEA